MHELKVICMLPSSLLTSFNFPPVLLEILQVDDLKSLKQSLKAVSNCCWAELRNSAQKYIYTWVSQLKTVIFFQFNFLNESGTQLYHFST
jgi:hypothetical protein